MKTLVAVFAVVFGFSVIGCAASSDDSSAESSETSQLVSDASASMTGAYESSADAVGQQAIRAIVFTRTEAGNGHGFFADIDTGLRCFTVPCPSTKRIEGWFTADSKTVTLHVSPVMTPYTTVDTTKFEGAYTYSLASGHLELSRDGVMHAYESVNTYCTSDLDCNQQSYIHQFCAGHASCETSSRCGYTCDSAQTAAN